MSQTFDMRAAVRQWSTQVREHTDADQHLPRLLLSFAHPTGLAQLYGGRPVRLSNVIREPVAQAHGRMQLQAILDAAQLQGRRLGLSNIQLAVGTVSWTEVSELPVMLRRLSVQEQGGDYLLTLQPGLRTNPDFLQLMREHGIDYPAQRVEDACWSLHGFAPGIALELVRQVTEGIDLQQFTVHDDAIVGIFTNPLESVISEMDMVGVLEESQLLRALAGNEGDRATLAQPLPVGGGADMDPDDELGVGDLEPQDQDILRCANVGRSFVVEAGPGVEPAPLTAALLAQAAQLGHTAVYATTDTPSAYAVLDAMRAFNLDRWVANLYDPENWRTHLAQQLVEGLERAMEGAGAPSEMEIEPAQEMPVDETGVDLLEAYSEASVNEEQAQQDLDTAELRSQLREVHERLSNYTNHLHRKHEPWNVSAYEALQVLADLIGMRPEPRTKVRFDLVVCRNIFQDGGQSAREALDQAAQLGYFTPQKRVDPWAGATIADEDAANAMVAAAKRLNGPQVAQMRDDMQRTAADTGLQPVTCVENWLEQLQLLSDVRDVLDVFEPHIFERSAADMIVATAPKAWRREHGHRMKRSVRRRLVKAARESLRPGTSVPDLHEALKEAQRQRLRWNERCGSGGWPRIPAGLDGMCERAQAVASDVEVLAGGFTGRNLQRMPMQDLIAMVDRLASAPDGAFTQPQLGAAVEHLTRLGLAPFAEDMQKRGVKPQMLVPEMDLAWWASVLNQILTTDDNFKTLEGPILDALSSRFRELDREQTLRLATELAGFLESRDRELVAAHAAEAAQALQMLREHPQQVLRALSNWPWLGNLVPVRLAPPLLAAAIHEDVDQLFLGRPQDTKLGLFVPLIRRAAQVVAIGEGGEDSGAWADLKAALPALAAAPSRVQSHLLVAALLSKYGFHTSATPVPAARATGQAELMTVDGRGMPALGASSVESTSAEVEKVVDLVLDHAVTRPDQSLAVCTPNERHGRNIREALLRAMATAVSGDDFFKSDKAEPFVVVTPQSARGVRRDRAIVSMGYAKTPHGRMLHDFGAISKPQGESVLASLLDVARDDLTLVTGFKLDDLNPERMTSAGERLFVDLYKMAEGGQLQDSAGWDTVGLAPDRLLVDLAERLYRVGLEVIPNLGVEGGYRIPLAIGHPDVPGELLVAVLTDDQRYVSEPSLRVRERHDIERLQAAGWVVRRVYSTAAFINPQGEADVLHRLVQQAVDLRLGRGQDEAESAVSEAAMIPVPADIEAWEQATISGQMGADESEDAPAGAAGDASVLGGDAAAVAEPGDAKTPTPERDIEQRAEQSDAISAQANGKGDHEQTTDVETPTVFAESYSVPRGPRPAVTMGLPLAAYSDAQLVQMLRWVASDQVPRTRAQFIRELFLVLGLTRSGRQVDAVLGFIVRSIEDELSLLDEPTADAQPGSDD